MFFYPIDCLKFRQLLFVIILYILVHRINIFPISATVQISDKFILFKYIYLKVIDLLCIARH